MGLLVATTTLGLAQEREPGEPTASDATALAKRSQNPVSDLISLPLQFNFYSGGGFGDRSSITLNLQPVLPIEVTPRWNVIARMIAPIVNLPDDAGASETGLGDLQAQLFVSPRTDAGFIWGIGPIFSLPTATLEARATGSWGLGPAAVGLLSRGPWVVGALVTQTWTIADYGDDREVNQLLVQPFVNFNFGQGWAISSSPIITANWEADGDNTWTVPLGGGLAWTTKIGDQAIQIGAQYFHNVERPDSAGANQLRLQLSFLFPKQAPPGAAAVARAPDTAR